MSGSRFGFGRPLRWLALLICAGGVALAMEHSWTDPIRPGRSFLDWISLMPFGETASLEAERTTAPIASSRSSLSTGELAELSMDRLLNGLLFSRPSPSWRLAPEQTAFASAWMTQQASDSLATSLGTDYSR